jgi:hypothetical protein
MAKSRKIGKTKLHFRGGPRGASSNTRRRTQRSIPLTESGIPKVILPHLEARDGGTTVIKELRHLYAPAALANSLASQTVWERVGQFFFAQEPPRAFEALRIYLALYEALLKAQLLLKKQVHKGMPLLWAAECFAKSGFPLLRKRFLMLALCEDAIRGKGHIDPNNTGVYFRLVWRLGMRDQVLQDYARRCFSLARQNRIDGRRPEWVLQSLGQDWLIEFPTPGEANVYVTSPSYIRGLLSQLGKTKGVALEILAEYLMQSMPGCRTVRRALTKSTDFDLVCSMEGYDVDFRSELGRYFVCECKDWAKPSGFGTIAKFCRVLDSVKAKFGILFSRNGISGTGTTLHAEREQLKVFQDRGMVIVVVDAVDLEAVAKGENFVNILRRKYEQVRLDLAT